MSRLPRCEVIDPLEVAVYHAISRTVRRCYLLAEDPVSGRNYDHRKDWIEEMLRHFSACFGIDLLSFSILSNHVHLILRSRPDVVKTWDDTEVARRWLMICPDRKIDGKPAPPSEAELNAIRNCPVKLAEIRTRLSHISWWMRLLKQRIGQRANKEEDQTGHFWQGRFRAIRIMDEESLLACAAYVDLNPIRAGLAETLETSDHSSVQRRIESEIGSAAATDSDSVSAEARPPHQRRDAFLGELTLDAASNAVPFHSSASGLRCSDMGFLKLQVKEYFALLDWTARQPVAGKRGSTPKDLPPILRRLGLTGSAWSELVERFEQNFCHIAGRCDCIEELRSHRTQRRFNCRPATRRLLPALN